jgi:hypothetical protein
MTNGSIYFRADHELIARVLAEKLRRRLDDGFRVTGARHKGALAA